MTDATAPHPVEELEHLFHYVHHRRTEAQIAGTLAPPTKVRDQAPHATVMQRFNSRFGLTITVGVGTMWCSYVFALVALLSLPSILHEVSPSIFSFFPKWLVGVSLTALVAWVSSYFLQLVLLPIIIVGQNLQAKASDERAEHTYQDAEAVLHEALQIQSHLCEQDKILTALVSRLGAALPPAAGGGGAPA